MSLFDMDRPLYTLTIGEYIQLHNKLSLENEKIKHSTLIHEDQIISSVKGLARFMHCSIPTAQKFKNNHPEIFHQEGKKFLVNKSDVLDKMRDHEKTY